MFEVKNAINKTIILNDFNGEDECHKITITDDGYDGITFYFFGDYGEMEESMWDYCESNAKKWLFTEKEVEKKRQEFRDDNPQINWDDPENQWKDDEYLEDYHSVCLNDGLHWFAGYAFYNHYKIFRPTKNENGMELEIDIPLQNQEMLKLKFVYTKGE